MKVRQVIGTALLGLLLAGPVRGQPAGAMLAEAASPYGFDETVQRIERTAAQRGFTLFARIDHAAAAAGAGLTLRPTVVLVFGNPRGGTPIMQAHPDAAIDLPLKALVWQGDGGQVRVATNTADFYSRHGVSPEQAAALAGAAALVEAALR